MSRMRASTSGPEPEEEAQWWAPEPGDVLTGTLKEVRECDLQRGTELVAFIRGRKGTLHAYPLYHKVLRSEWRKKRPAVGRRLAITYKGERPSSRKGRTYHDYEIDVLRVPEPMREDFQRMVEGMRFNPST